MDLNELLALATDAAKKANAAIMQNYDKFDVFVKADRSPLTNADLAANDAIMRTLEPSGIAICSEERVLDSKQRMSEERFWLIDPLDGTKEFIARNGEFCVCIALIEHGRPILAAMYIAQTAAGSIKTVRCSLAPLVRRKSLCTADIANPKNTRNLRKDLKCSSCAKALR